MTRVTSWSSAYASGVGADRFQYRVDASAVAQDAEVTADRKAEVCRPGQLAALGNVRVELAEDRRDARVCGHLPRKKRRDGVRWRERTQTGQQHVPCVARTRERGAHGDHRVHPFTCA